MKTWNICAILTGTRLTLALALGAALLNSAFAGPEDEADRKMLSKHQTVAQFGGIKEHKCLGRTALCPDQCGHSGDLATFRILKYLTYEKPGQYGDPQQKQYQFLVQDNLKNIKVPPGIKADVESLQAGDYILLDWQHDYVTTQGGSKYPVRTVLQIKRITRDEADKLTGGLDKLPKEEPKVRPQSPATQPPPKVR